MNCTFYDIEMIIIIYSSYHNDFLVFSNHEITISFLQNLGILRILFLTKSYSDERKVHHTKNETIKK